MKDVIKVTSDLLAEMEAIQIFGGMNESTDVASLPKNQFCSFYPQCGCTQIQCPTQVLCTKG